MLDSPNLTAKTQSVRLADVFFIGPVMIYAAGKLPEREKTLGVVLGLLGIATVLYNARNYLAIRGITK
tara:strand:- start:183 stop:386 length:204 start_codon:yes stop_codon:yes gene_type:complete